MNFLADPISGLGTMKNLMGSFCTYLSIWHYFILYYVGGIHLSRCQDHDPPMPCLRTKNSGVKRKEQRFWKSTSWSLCSGSPLSFPCLGCDITFLGSLVSQSFKKVISPTTQATGETIRLVCLMLVDYLSLGFKKSLLNEQVTVKPVSPVVLRAILGLSHHDFHALRILSGW